MRNLSIFYLKIKNLDSFNSFILEFNETVILFLLLVRNHPEPIHTKNLYNITL